MNSSQQLLGGAINEGHKTNKSMHHISKVRHLPQVFTAATPVKKGYRMLASKQSCRSNSKLIPSAGFSINQATKEKFPSLFEIRNDSASKINQIAENAGFKIPRSLSQPRHKSTSQVKNVRENVGEQVIFQKARLHKSISKHLLQNAINELC